MAQKKYVSLEKLGLYHEKEVARVNGLISTAKAEANAYADSLATNYDAAGMAVSEAGKVQTKLDEEVTRAKGREDEIAGLVTKAQGDVTTLAGKVGEVAEGSTVVGMIDAVDAIADANAADIVTMKGQIDALEKGTYDDTEVRGLIKTNADAIDALEETHATDKTALEGSIALKADQTALDGVSAVANAAVKQSDYDTKVAALDAEDARIVGLVEAEAERAAGVESGLNTRLTEVETFFKTAEGETLDAALDTLVEIQKYVTDEGAAADQMVKDIAANAEAIGQNADDIEALEGRMQTAEDKLADIEASADANVIEVVKVNGQALTVTDKAVDVIVPTGALASKDVVAESDLDTALATKLNGMTDADELAAAISAERTLIDVELAKKVDKVDGKGLSTNDLTNELKGQYDAAYAHSQEAHAPADAQKNIIETVKVNGTAVTVTDKAVDIVVPTDNAQLTNGAKYLVAADIANKADKGTTLASYGIGDAYTKTEVDTVVSNAIGQFEECSEAEINALFA